MALVFMEKCANKFTDKFAKPFTDKEVMALFWLVAFLTLGAALKAHQVHAKRWGEAFMAPPPVVSEMRVAAAAAGDSLVKPLAEPVQVAARESKPARNAGKGKTGSCPIILNAATAVQLQSLPGVGEKMAERILAHREKFGPFRKVDDLLAVKGIGQKKLDRMRGCLIL